MSEVKFVIEGFAPWRSDVLSEDTKKWNKLLASMGIIYYNIGKDRKGEYYMKNPKWLVEDFDPDNRFGDLAVEASNQGCDVRVEKYTPFEEGNLNYFKDDDIVITQTSINLAIQIQRQTNWKPGPWLTAENYECTKYYPILQSAGIPLLNGKGQFFKKKDVQVLIDKLVRDIGEPESGRVFIRPSSGLKPFTGMVFIYNSRNYDTFEQDWYWVSMSCKDDDMLLVAPPLAKGMDSIINEWRFIAAEGEIITGSQYYNGNYEGTWEDGAYELAVKTAKIYQPDPMYTVDICKTDDGNYHVMELNSFRCAGLYGCDLKPVVERAIDIARRQYENMLS
jgi:hypothetical protein